MAYSDVPSAPLRGAVDLSALTAPVPAPVEGEAAAFIVQVTEESIQELARRSGSVPVVINLGSSASPVSSELTARLEAIAREFGGKFILGNCDIDAQPAIAQAFQVQAVPAVLALIGGRPAPLFQGNASDEQIREVIGQVLEVAQQAGVTSVAAGDEAAPVGEPEPEPLPPLHQAAFDAIERDDLPAAIEAFEQALRENPKDADARAGHAQVSLMERTRDLDLHKVRQAAADAPDDIDAQLSVADLDIAGGKVEDALMRLIDVVRASAGDDREKVRLRLVELFDVVGADDPRVVQARQALASALY